MENYKCTVCDEIFTEENKEYVVVDDTRNHPSRQHYNCIKNKINEFQKHNPILLLPGCSTIFHFFDQILSFFWNKIPKILLKETKMKNNN